MNMNTTNSRRLLQIVPVQGRVDLQLAARSSLQSVGHCLGDDVLPLGHCTAGDTGSSSDGCAVSVEVIENDGFIHTPREYSMLNHVVKDAGPGVGYPAYMESMGERIRRLREAQNLTQSRLGELVGVSKSAVSQWEDGSTANIKLTVFLSLCEVLRTDPHYLVYGPERAPEDPVATGQSRRPSRSRLR